MLGSEKVFIFTVAQTHGPGHEAAYQCSEPSYRKVETSSTVTFSLEEFHSVSSRIVNYSKADELASRTILGH